MAEPAPQSAQGGDATEVYAFLERYGLADNASWMAAVLFIRDLLPRLTIFPVDRVAEIQAMVVAALERRDFSEQALGRVVAGLSKAFHTATAERLAEIEAKLEAERAFSISLLTAIQDIAPQIHDAARKHEDSLAGLDADARKAVLGGLDRQMLAAKLSELIAQAIEKAREESQKLEKKVKVLEYRARIDPLLTSLHNRRSFDEYIDEIVKRRTGSAAPVSLLMIDVDRFKDINDTHGHQAGDDMLRALAKIVSEAAKHTGGFAARYGGEELVVLLRDTGLGEAVEVAEALRRTVEGYDFLIRSDDTPSQNIHFTVSIGVADLAGSRKTAADLVGAADKAMYLAKKSGRNRVVRYKD